MGAPLCVHLNLGYILTNKVPKPFPMLLQKPQCKQQGVCHSTGKEAQVVSGANGIREETNEPRNNLMVE